MYIVASLTTTVALLALSSSPGPEGPVRMAQAPATPSDPAKQANCRKAIEHVLQELRQPVEAREKARKDELEAKILGLIAENRRKGIDECITWNQVMKLTFKQ